MSKQLILNCLLTIVILLCALVNVRPQDTDTQEINPPGENVVLQWNRVLQETIRTPGQQPPTIFSVRSFAMMHAAMFDAVNSIDGSYTSYLTDVTVTGRASQEAAAQSCTRCFIALYPTRQAVFDAELNISLQRNSVVSSVSRH